MFLKVRDQSASHMSLVGMFTVVPSRRSTAARHNKTGCTSIYDAHPEYVDHRATTSQDQVRSATYHVVYASATLLCAELIYVRFG